MSKAVHIRLKESLEHFVKTERCEFLEKVTLPDVMLSGLEAALRHSVVHVTETLADVALSSINYRSHEAFADESRSFLRLYVDGTKDNAETIVHTIIERRHATENNSYSREEALEQLSVYASEALEKEAEEENDASESSPRIQNLLQVIEDVQKGGPGPVWSHVQLLRTLLTEGAPVSELEKWAPQYLTLIIKVHPWLCRSCTAV